MAGLFSKPTSWQPPEPGELACLLFQPANWQPLGSCKMTSLLFNPTSWQPPRSCKLTDLLFKQTGQAVIEKDKLLITPEPPDVSAHAGLRDSSEHARVRVPSKEGVG